MTNKRILIVDDEDVIVQLYQLQLGDRYEIEIAHSGEIGLELIAAQDQFAVVVSDMNMPGGMSGAEFLNQVRQVSPESVRVMLTGVDLREVASVAVNQGQVFRFLTKPCPAEQLAKTIDESLEQYRIKRAEKDLLDKTLSGSVRLLVDMLSISSPLAFGRAARVRRTVEGLCGLSGVSSSWEIVLAAMLCEVGCISLNEEILQKLHYGEPLTAHEQLEFARHPELGSKLVSRIPRLENIGRLIAAQLRPFSDAMDYPDEAELIQRANYLHVSLEYDRLLQAGISPLRAAATIRLAPRKFSPTIAGVLSKHVEQQLAMEVEEVSVSALRPGMVTDCNIETRDGTVVVTKGQQLTELQVSQIRRLGSQIRQPIFVNVQAAKDAMVPDARLDITESVELSSALA
ncbi:response regulator [Rubripirellula amarantea]|nr:HD domain-containing phosphohydrolase [Rubripirellula amarantea]